MHNHSIDHPAYGWTVLAYDGIGYQFFGIAILLTGILIWWRNDLDGVRERFIAWLRAQNFAFVLGAVILGFYLFGLFIYACAVNHESPTDANAVFEAIVSFFTFLCTLALVAIFAIRPLVRWWQRGG